MSPESMGPEPVSTVGSATWPRMGERPVVLVPVGSTEQHGPHLPMSTDTVIAEAVTVRVAARMRAEGATVWTAPPIHYGASGEHQDFPGTMSIGNEALDRMLVELVRSLSTWAGRVVLVNAHGGNVVALGRAVTQLVAEEHDVAWVPCATEEVDAHAGRTETSLMLHLAPDTVLLDRAEVGNTTDIQELLPDLIAGGVRGVSANGVLGDPTGASADEGARVSEGIVADVHERIRTSRRDTNGSLARPAHDPRPVPRSADVPVEA